MANLDQIQQLLNTNQEYRNRFLQDPVSALAQQGLQLSIDMQNQLRQLVQQARVGPATTPGAAAGNLSSPVLLKPFTEKASLPMKGKVAINISLKYYNA